jgi:hypothetical protein
MDAPQPEEQAANGGVALVGSFAALTVVPRHVNDPDEVH